MRWMKCWATIARRANLRNAALLLVILALPPGSALPQETTLRSQANVVLIPALVKDQRGAIVYGLEAKDFIVEDDSMDQPVRLDEAPEAQPISLVIAIQRGRRAYHEFPRMQGLKCMLEPLFTLGTARVAVIEFDSNIEVTRNFTQNATQVSADLTNIQPGDEGAAILDAVSSSVDLLKQEPKKRQRVLLLISETRDHGSKAKIDSVVAAIGQSDTVIYALGTTANPIIAQTTPGLKVNKWGYIEVDENTGMTSIPGVFAGGDIVTGAATVILAMGAGKRAARGMLEFMGIRQEAPQEVPQEV
jgi:hypothetical protein